MVNEIAFPEDKRSKDFRWVERMSKWMDSEFSIGKFKFGLDPILNFIPLGGQTASFGISLMLVIVMYRNGVGSKVAVKMLLNVMLDAILGSIPLIGNIFDFFNKANQKNIKLLKEHYFEEKHQGSAKGLLISIFFILFLLCGVIFYMMWLLGEWLFSSIENLF
ncbi:DUF4112 domain-containing protein [Sphingobacterium olei]|uniref:DUF4112 domain-containing protein n=1 Tax=Sphingobacterium olei TaxID=2571155 RepID=A0A4U0P4M2_9SPHI|nr:DUF4112 domain-containing protein [Sphingobacterium olei]TJZ62285.1 DUF4112 domain-containing protein [Sphingobacterium olei]